MNLDLCFYKVGVIIIVRVFLFEIFEVLLDWDGCLSGCICFSVFLNCELCSYV